MITEVWPLDCGEGVATGPEMPGSGVWKREHPSPKEMGMKVEKTHHLKKEEGFFSFF